MIQETFVVSSLVAFELESIPLHSFPDFPHNWPPPPPPPSPIPPVPESVA